MRAKEERTMKSLALIAIAILLLVPQISSGINTSPLITQGNGSEHHESVAGGQGQADVYREVT